MSLVSIIVPVYNAAPYLTDCVNSILSQSFQDFELLLVDDGSTDESPKICDELAASDSRIRVFHKKNGGVSSARNKGLEEACGQWIYFCDADDIVLPNCMRILLSESNDKDMVMAGYESYDVKTGKISTAKTHYYRTFDKKEALTQMITPLNSDYQGFLWNKLFRKSLIDSLNLCFDERIKFNEDRLFITEYLLGIEREVLFTTTAVYRYIRRENGAMSSVYNNFNPHFETDLDAMCRMYQKVKQVKNESLVDLFRQGVFSSFKFVSKMASVHNAYSKRMRIRLLNKLIQNVGISYFIRWKLGIYKVIE